MVRFVDFVNFKLKFLNNLVILESIRPSAFAHQHLIVLWRFNEKKYFAKLGNMYYEKNL